MSKTLFNDFEKEIAQATDFHAVSKVKTKFLDKNGVFQANFMANFKNLSKTEKITKGRDFNLLKKKCLDIFNSKIAQLNLAKLEEKLKNSQEDVTEPYCDFETGAIHPLSKVINEVTDFFKSYNFNIINAQEVEMTEINFEDLNTDIFHVTRDYNETFYINDKLILRTHATNATARHLKKFSADRNCENYKAIAIGNVYRRDTNDATHSHQFIQADAFCVGKYNLSDLISILEAFCKYFFADKSNIRIRPSFFPFTCPSIEIDVSCFKCDQRGCNLCKNLGWIEILGAGVLHPEVLRKAKIDPTKYTAIAFGMGIERIAMLKYNIKDIRHFYNNDLRFLNNFVSKVNTDNES